VQIVAQNGYLRRLLKLLFPEMHYGVNAYTLWASAVVLALHVYPLVYYGVGNALRLLGNAFEHSARMCGASRRRILFRVIIPLVMPAFISTGLLVVSRTMANFGVPAQLAMPRGNEVLSTRVYSIMSDLNLPVVAVMSLLLVVVSMTLFLLSEWALRGRGYESEGASPSAELAVVKLGRWQTPVSILTGLFFGVSIVIPLTTIFVSSFFKRWGLALALNHLTFGNYLKLFGEERILTQPLINSLICGLSAATVAAITASLIVYFYRYQKGMLTSGLINIAQLPIAIPNIILAVAATFAWINEPFKLYGTRKIIIVTYTVLFIPICIKQMLGAAKNLDRSMDSAARTMGISLLKRYTHLFLPQIKSSLLSGFLICFLISLKEIPISLLLYSAGTQTLGVMLFRIQSNAYGLEMTSAVAVVVIVLSMMGHLILNRIGTRGYKV
jgi:iron(III) transport system permease protein